MRTTGRKNQYAHAVRQKGSRACVALVLASLVALAPRISLCATPGSVTLRLKPTAAPVEYWVRTVEDQRREWPTGQSQEASYDTLDLVRQTATAMDGGKLRVEVRILAREMTINGQRLNDRMFAARTISYTMDARGVQLDGGGKEDVAAQIWPVLPEAAVAAGTAWEITPAPSKDFPFHLAIHNVFKGMEDVSGQPCAVIRSSGSTVGKDKSSGVSLKASVDGTVAIAPGEGTLVKALSLIRCDVRYAKPATDGHQVLRRQIYRIIQRHVQGDVAPGPPAGGD